jgi:23S rRNA (guanosine2251-2'-O)-methyltransferase
VARQRTGARRREVEELCRRHRLRLVEISEGDLTARLGADLGSHNGFAAEVEATALDAVVSAGDPDLVVLVEDVQDPRNLGALLRVCEGAGVGRVLVRDRGSTPFTSTVMRTSAGASEHLDLERVTNSARQIETLQGEGFWSFGADAAGVAPWEVDLSGKVLLCLGGEEKGLRQRTRGLCDHLVGLPMRGRVESLNLATAAAALLYEAVRQRS